MLDYKDIITKRYVLNMSGTEIARQLECSKSGVNDFLHAFQECKTLSEGFPKSTSMKKAHWQKLMLGKK